MSVKLKLPLLVLAAFIVNILLLAGYYKIFLSTEISENHNQVQEKLQVEANQMAKDLKNNPDFKEELKKISQEKNLIIRLEDESGNLVFNAGSDSGMNLEQNAASLFSYDNHIYLLRVTQPILITRVSSFLIARNLFKSEIIIICFILILIEIAIFYKYVKPVLALQESMERYKSGVRPVKVLRKDEIGLLQNRFVELTDTIEEEKQKQNRIIASISHDIKTPLTSVMGYAERLKKNTLSPERHELYVNTIYNKSVAIKNLIEEFDEYLNYHMQSELKEQKITVEKLCIILRSDYQEELKERGVGFSIHCDCGQETLSVDISKMRRVFGNIISNSLKHFKTDKPEIAVFCTKQENTVLFSVEDNGTGTAEEELKKIFDPFYTSDQSRSFAGLGLSICKEIVEAHNGKIWAKNRASGGLSLRICLPII